MTKRFLSLLSLFLVIAAIAAIGIGCTTTKNTGTAVKEGTQEGAEEVADKTEDAAEEVGDKAEDVGEAVVGTAEKAGQEVEDGSITAAIKAKFANDETVSASKIDVDTNDGMVTLTGTVSSQIEIDRALELAKTVDGVKMVHNNLTIQPQQ
jgi:hyperosmotically inducible protein